MVSYSLRKLLSFHPELLVDESTVATYGDRTAYWHKGHGIRIHTAGKGYKYLHNFLFPDHECVDHKDRNTANNLLSNLRGCTKQQNNINKEVINPDSGYRGVSWNKDRGFWYARLQVKGQGKTSSGYSCPDAAAAVYNSWAKKYFGEFAQLNDVGNPKK